MLRVDQVPSKKQTPFGVWYKIHQDVLPRLLPVPSKKQTPFGVWYVNYAAPNLMPNYAPQRSRRLSASGISRDKIRVGSIGLPLKEADAFRRLVC